MGGWGLSSSSNPGPSHQPFGLGIFIAASVCILTIYLSFFTLASDAHGLESEMYC